MLKIFYSRDDLNKDAFLFASLDLQEKSLVIVPDQYTLSTEENALKYLNVEGFIDFEILTFSRLRSRVLDEVAIQDRVFLSKYGRYMLLSRIMAYKSAELEAYRGYGKSKSFLDILNNFIKDLKLENVTSQDIENVLRDLPDSQELSKKKLRDINSIYKEYEEKLEGKFIDAEDYLKLFIDNISKSKSLKESTIWIYGFDTFTAKNLDVITELIRNAKSVNLILSYDPDDRLFDETGRLINDLKKNNAEYFEGFYPIGRNFKKERPACLRFLEEELYRYPYKEYSDECAEIDLISAANYYAEANTVAAKIRDLVRDRAYRYKDILLICNDMDERVPVLSRVLAEYDIPSFIDGRKTLVHNPAIEYIKALLDLLTYNYRQEDFFKLIKTAFTDIGRSKAEDLENYAIKYKISGNRWKKEFKYGKNEKDLDLDSLNESRLLVYEPIESFSMTFKKAETAKEKVQALQNYLEEDIRMPQRIEEMVEKLEENKIFAYAEEMSQVWEVITDVFDQVVAILGDSKLNNKDFATILSSGFEVIDIGVLPTGVDQVKIGDAQRTRTSDVKALFIIGANDGVFPRGGESETLLDDLEMSLLSNKNISKIKKSEEQIAIYRTFTKAEEYIHISYSGSDSSGKETKPSPIFEKLKGMFPAIEVKKDILNRGDDSIFIENKGHALRYLSDEIRRGEELSDLSRAIISWFKEYDREALEKIEDGLKFGHPYKNIDLDYLDDLYRKREGAFLLSPSSLERFARCPFSFFMDYGLRLHERRVFEVDSRGRGEIYHQALMMYGRYLLEPLSRKESDGKIDEIFDEIISSYKEDLLSQGQYEVYSAERYKKVTKDVAWALSQQAKEGAIDSMSFETSFPPIELDLDDRRVLIEGKIDRMDVINSEYAKIIDYKSGNVGKFDPEDVRAGWSLQLMIYLKGMGKYKPAAVFYFEIKEANFDVEGTSIGAMSEEVEKKLSAEYRLNGVVLDKPEILEAIGQENIKYKKNIMTEEVFEDLLIDADKLVRNLCKDLLTGSIDVNPLVVKDKDPCDYCLYRAICKYE